jgi:hypothetical protein
MGRVFSLLLALGACAPDPNQFEGGESALATSDPAAFVDDQAAPPSPLALWYTCGDPVCRGWSPHPGVPDCNAFQEGDTCPRRAAGRTCDPHDACNRELECRRDPNPPGPCPISRAAFKHDIRYLDAAATDALGAAALQMKLATWQYNGEPAGAKQHVGFIIDDAPTSAAVAADGDHVDLYGYTSMAVAALQAQQRQLDAQAAQLAAQSAQLAAMQAELKALQAQRSAR